MLPKKLRINSGECLMEVIYGGFLFLQLQLFIIIKSNLSRSMIYNEELFLIHLFPFVV